MSLAISGRSLGLMTCTDCRLTVKAAPHGSMRCPRCHAELHSRKPYSVRLTTTLVVTAALLYIPANLLPVMRTRSLLSDDSDTIMSGVITLIQDGSWPLAILVFVASIVVPILKLLAMGYLLISIQGRSRTSALQRCRLFRLVEFIGRWSMLDIYAVSVLITLVQIQSLASISVGPGAMAFAAVVVLTMLAAQTFDERLLWDTEGDHG